MPPRMTAAREGLGRVPDSAIAARKKYYVFIAVEKTSCAAVRKWLQKKE